MKSCQHSAASRSPANQSQAPMTSAIPIQLMEALLQSKAFACYWLTDLGWWFVCQGPELPEQQCDSTWSAIAMTEVRLTSKRSLAHCYTTLKSCCGYVSSSDAMRRLL